MKKHIQVLSCVGCTVCLLHKANKQKQGAALTRHSAEAQLEEEGLSGGACVQGQPDPRHRAEVLGNFLFPAVLKQIARPTSPQAPLVTDKWIL